MFDRLSYEERAGHAKNALGKQLFELMARKKSNLAVAADVSTSAAVLQLADQVGTHFARQPNGPARPDALHGNWSKGGLETSAVHCSKMGYGNSLESGPSTE